MISPSSELRLGCHVVGKMGCVWSVRRGLLMYVMGWSDDGSVMYVGGYGGGPE